ncbi:uncharacterized protein TRIADDRAFT_30313, partial [Trichoplax adhaerens]
RNFILALFMHGSPEKPSSRLINGQITFTEFLPLFEKQLTEASIAQGVQLPERFSINDFFTDCIDCLRPNQLVLDSISNLQEAGYKVCFLGNIGLIEGPTGNKFTRMKINLRFTCDYYFESCQVGMARPDPKFYQHALKEMNVKADEVISVESTEQYCKLATSIGMTGIVAEDQPTVLKKLSELTGINFSKLSRPAACNPDSVTHCYFTTTSGVKIHFVEKGNGPAVILSHGFPEFWYTWRHQIPFLARLGYRVIALDHRGYGESDQPPNIDDYSMKLVNQDIIDLMDNLNIHQAVLIGHDWGSVVVWEAALRFPDRIKAVASLNLGYFPPHPEYDFTQLVQADPQQFDYCLYFFDEGVAEVELEKDVDRTLRYIYSDTTPKVYLLAAIETSSRGLLAGLPDELPKCSFMSDKEFNYCVKNYKKNGFHYPLNWYRNEAINWNNIKSIERYKIYQPALMVTAEYDPILLPELTNGMEEYVPNLTRANLLCGHWTQSECPAELNRVLSKWLPKVSAN